MLLRLFSLGLILGLVGLAVVFNREIADFSTTTLTRQKAQPALESGNLEHVIGIYEGALHDNPSNVALALKLASYYLKEKQDDRAEKIYLDILEQRPEHVPTRIAYAAMLAREPKTANEAVLQYRKALAEDPANPLLLNRVGQLYRQAAANPAETREEVKSWLLDWAIYYYRLSLKLDPALYNSRFGVGISYQMRGKAQPAARHYCNAVIIRPAAYEARFNLGLALVELKYTDAGFRQMNRAKRILSDEGKMAEVQRLAEEIYTVKSGIFYDTAYAGLKNDHVPEFLNPACFAEEETPGKKADSFSGSA